VFHLSTIFGQWLASTCRRLGYELCTFFTFFPDDFSFVFYYQRREQTTNTHARTLAHTHSERGTHHTHTTHSYTCTPLNDEIPRKALTTLGSSSRSPAPPLCFCCVCVKERYWYLYWCAFRHNFCVGQPSTFDFSATFHTNNAGTGTHFHRWHTGWALNRSTFHSFFHLPSTQNTKIRFFPR